MLERAEDTGKTNTGGQALKATFLACCISELLIVILPYYMSCRKIVVCSKCVKSK